MHPLDNPVWAALTTVHHEFAQHRGRARRYPSTMAPFGAVEALDAEAVADLATLGDTAALVRPEIRGLPANAREVARRTVRQYLAPPFEDEAFDGDMRALTSDDVPQMIKLTGRAKPGPFSVNTIAFGGYLGIFDDDRLVAMAGRRLALPGYREISAVCTHDQHQRRGYAARLTRAVGAAIQRDGDDAFLHVLISNERACTLYERLGCTPRGTIDVVIVQFTP